MATVDDVAAEAGVGTGDVLASCRALGIVATGGASGLSADEHRRLRQALGADGLPPVVGGSTSAEPGRPVPARPASLSEEVASQPRRLRLSHRAVTRIALATFLLAAVGAALVSLDDDSTDEPTSERSCVDLPEGGGTPEPVPCDGPHDAEVVDRHVLADGPYPGDAAIAADAEARCAPAVEDAGGAPVLLVPTEATWARGDRTVTCLVEPR